MTGVIVYPEAEIPEFFGRFTTVCETVKDGADTGSMECLQFVEDVDHPAIVGRIGYVEGDDMKKRAGHGKLR